jgi:seryl-tRNA synthetase
MIDLKLIRENPDLVKSNCKKRSCDINIDELIKLEKENRELLTNIENLRAERNQLSKECRTKPEAREQVKALKIELGKLEESQKRIEKELNVMLFWLPNLLHPSVPDGGGDEDNEELRLEGVIPEFSFKPKDHQELGEILDIIDTKRGSKVAKSGFYYWKGKGAQLANALFFWTQQQLINRGFTSLITPCVAKERTLFGTGYLPFCASESFAIEGENLALIGTSEQTLVGYHADEIFDADEVPFKYCAFSPCFRTEAGSYGKATRGIFRVHQFHKVEQIIFCMPEDSEKYHEECLENEEFILKALGIPYKVLNVCVGDMGAPGYKKYDIDAFFAGYNGYREVTSNTNLTDFQTRRLNIRYKTKDGKRGLLHTISATAVTDRVLIAILENFQQEDGSIIIPEVLRGLCGFDKIEPKKK